jgi:hypothetical protein
MVTTRVATAPWGLYALETSLSPRPVLGKGVAARMPFARAAQARGRSSPRQRDTTRAKRRRGWPITGHRS